MGFFLIPMLALVSLSGSSWSENIGWVNFSGPGYRATIDGETGALGGYAWSDRLGWMKLAGDTGRMCSATEGGDCSNVISSNSGEWDGIVKFKGTNYGAKITGTKETGCTLTGYAWGSNVVGWLHLNGAQYGVALDECIVPTELPHIQSLSCSFNVGPKVLIFPQRTARLTWDCTDADRCRITPAPGVVTPATGGAVTVRPLRTTPYILKCDNDSGQSVEIEKIVTVVQSRLCEINPADPICE